MFVFMHEKLYKACKYYRFPKWDHSSAMFTNIEGNPQNSKSDLGNIAEL